MQEIQGRKIKEQQGKGNSKKCNYLKMSYKEVRDFYKKKTPKKEYTNNAIEDLIYDKQFITKMSNQNEYRNKLSWIPVPQHTWQTQKKLWQTSRTAKHESL